MGLNTNLMFLKPKWWSHYVKHYIVLMVPGAQLQGKVPVFKPKEHIYFTVNCKTVLFFATIQINNYGETQLPNNNTGLRNNSQK